MIDDVVEIHSFDDREFCETEVEGVEVVGVIAYFIGQEAVGEVLLESVFATQGNVGNVGIVGDDGFA